MTSRSPTPRPITEETPEWKARNCMIDWFTYYQAIQRETLLARDSARSIRYQKELEEMSGQIRDMSLSDWTFNNATTNALMTVADAFESKTLQGEAMSAFRDSFQMDRLQASLAVEMAHAQLEEEECQERLAELGSERRSEVSEDRDANLQKHTKGLADSQANLNVLDRMFDTLSDQPYQRNGSAQLSSLPYQPESPTQPQKSSRHGWYSDIEFV